MFSDNRIALCHEWITTYGGSDQVAQRIAVALNVDTIFTYAGDPELVEKLFPGRDVQIIRGLGQTPWGARNWQLLLADMPRAWRMLDLSGYDVVITSSHAATNAIRVGPGATHMSYCHTPMRYAWQWREETRRIPLPLRPLWPVIAALFRAADRRWAQRVDVFVANSRNVAERIRSFYGRDSIVVYPPVDTGFWTPGNGARDTYFLCAGRMVPYKRVDLVVRAAVEAGASLVVAGNGPELVRLKKLARDSSVEFVIDPDAVTLRDLYRRAQALVFAGIEDFGMMLVEAQACGTPVIAFAGGGALESVVDGRTGRLYEDRSVLALAEILRTFNPNTYDPEELRRHAEGFGIDRFDSELRAIVAERIGPQ